MEQIKLEKYAFNISEAFITELYRQKGKVTNRALGFYIIEYGDNEFSLSILREGNCLYYKMKNLSTKQEETEFYIHFKDFFTQVNPYATASHRNGEELIQLALKLTPQHYNKLFRKKRIRILKERKERDTNSLLTHQEFINKLLDGYNLNDYLHSLTYEEKYKRRAKRILQTLHYVTNSSK